MLCCAACSWIDQWRNNQQEAVAQVAGQVLYRNDILAILPDDLTSDDSAQFVQNYIRSWIDDQLLYSTAQQNIGKSQEIENLTNAYRKQLIINAYEQQLVAENLPEINEDSLHALYDTYKEHFPLESAIVKGVFIKTNARDAELKQLKAWLSATGDEKWENISAYCSKHALFYDIFTENWYSIDKIYQMAADSAVCAHIQLSSELQQIKSANATYLVLFTELQHEGGPQPYDFIYPELQKILTNRQKIQYLKKFRQDLYEQAEKKHSIVWYYEKS